jgi:DNA polymerase III subunit gamma/tau
MADYQPLALQLRPQFFKDFIYNEPIILILKNMILKDQIPNGIIFSGTRGIGKTTLARILARSLNCQDRKETEFEPCGKCESCKESVEGIHPDILEIDGATHGNIEDIRKILDQAVHTPMMGLKKIFIVDEAHNLGRSQASWDALLKILEEPPEHVVWVFCTTQKHKIPDVIRSRLVSLDLRMVPTKIIEKYIMEILAKKDLGFGKIPTYDVAPIIANTANNSIRDGLTLLEKVMPYCDEKGWSKQTVLEAIGSFDSLKIPDILGLIVQKNSAGLWATLNTILESGIEAEPLFEALTSIINNLMTIYLGGFVEQSALFTPFMSHFAPPRIIYLCDTVLKRARDLAYSSNKKMVIQVTAMELCV